MWSSTRATTWIAPPTSIRGWASRLTERGYHSLGSMNHLAMFGTDYLELIAVPKGATTGRMDLLNFPVWPERPGVRLGGFGRHLR